MKGCIRMAIHFDKETRTFYLEGKNLSYVFCINETEFPEHYYFGTPIARDNLRYAIANGGDCFEKAVPGCQKPWRTNYNNYWSEFSVYGQGDYHEPMLQVMFENGSRITEFLYESYEILEEKPTISGMPSLKGGETLKLILKDKNSEMRVALYYTVYEDLPVICRRMAVINDTKEPVKLLRAYSFTLELPKVGYDMLTLQGGWARERGVDRQQLAHGITVIDSKCGSSSHKLNPFVAVTDKNTTEDAGMAIGVNLVYSSSFAMKADVGSRGTTRIVGGINDFDFSWKLAPGEVFETPEAVIVYSDKGLGEMSRTFHDAYRNYLINPRYVNAKRPVVINNWEATYFDFDNQRLMDIIDVVKGSGIDTFVLDDGWFGKRDSDHSGLGDWFVNTEKLAGGLDTIIDYVHNAGMNFGLWFEPEMISPDSDLYRAHPDWAIQVPGVTPALGRFQLVLDITRDEVRDYVIEAVSKILREHKIEYVKWDCNTNVTENFSSALPADRQQEYHHRYALALYDMCERLVNGFPHIFFEGCSGGGGRFDPAMMYYFPQIWTSDDTDAVMRTQIQYGTSMCYPLSVMSCHTSICPNHQTGRTTPFKTRADIAHLGATGYELDTKKMTDEEVYEVSAQIADYHEMEELVLQGDLYRFEDPFTSNYFGFTVISKDKSEAVITVMRRLVVANDEVKRIYPTGLDENALYEVRELKRELHGSTLMKRGIVIPFQPEDFKTFVYHLKKVN